MADNTAFNHHSFPSHQSLYYSYVWWKQFLYWQSYIASVYPSINDPRYTWPNQQPPPPQPTLTIQIRLTDGFETYVASLWRRFIAEVIDVLLIGLVVKTFVPMIDYRIPDVAFLGTNEVMELSNEELEEASWELLVFILSVITERISHAAFESFCLYMFGFTPGKWLMGLKIYKCISVQYTNTDPRNTIKIKPGTNISLGQAILRSTFKSFVSMFCPLMLFFITLEGARPHYDRLFKTTIVHHHRMYRPV